MHSRDASRGEDEATGRKVENDEDPKDLREANRNIRKSQGDDAVDSTAKRAGNRPVFDRDR